MFMKISLFLGHHIIFTNLFFKVLLEHKLWFLRIILFLMIQQAVLNISVITFLEMQIFSPNSDLLNQKHPSNCVLTSSPDDPEAT